MPILLLSGPANVGKTTLIKQALIEKQLQPAGIFSQPIAGVGFALYPAAQLVVPQSQPATHIFIDRRYQPTWIKPQLFANYGVKLLTAARRAPVVLLDEIGGVDLLAPQFYAALLSLLAQPIKIIGVIKSTTNYRKQKQRQHFDVTRQRHTLWQQVQRQRGQIVTVNQNQTAVYQQLSQFLTATNNF
uniref:Uncharacterized protein n=1 Tax=Loigolactobacillus rennini TaxID=238013 RepID=A0A1K2I975_9LACO|nr:hypothetical protein LREN565_2068 [Loigolactobacillus rennini]